MFSHASAVTPQADHPMCSWLTIVDTRRTKEILKSMRVTNKALKITYFK